MWSLTGVVSNEIQAAKLRSLIYRHGLENAVEFDVHVAPEMVKSLQTNGVCRTVDFLRKYCGQGPRGHLTVTNREQGQTEKIEDQGR